MHIALWIVQGLLAFAFGAAGLTKLLTPAAELAQNMAWIQHAPSWAPAVIGVLELLGAIGLILPAALRIKPTLTVAAAGGLLLTMVGAVFTHVALGEFGGAVPSVVLGALSAFVLVGRRRFAPITPRA